MIGRKKDVSYLEEELREVEARISAHPLASRRIRAAGAVVHDHREQDAAEIDRRLAAEGLPSVEQLGRTHASGTWTWWRLHRRKRTLEKKIRRART
ncbi:hypothetical protein ACI78T_13015 [Blastococcus sp. SYSU D00922]